MPVAQRRLQLAGQLLNDYAMQISARRCQLQPRRARLNDDDMPTATLRTASKPMSECRLLLEGRNIGRVKHHVSGRAASLGTPLLFRPPWIALPEVADWPPPPSFRYYGWRNHRVEWLYICIGDRESSEGSVWMHMGHELSGLHGQIMAQVLEERRSGPWLGGLDVDTPSLPSLHICTSVQLPGRASGWHDSWRLDHGGIFHTVKRPCA